MEPQSVHLRIYDAKMWLSFRMLAKQRNMSANGLINTLLTQFVSRHNLPTGMTQQADS